MRVFKKEICSLACLSVITLLASTTLHAADQTDRSSMLRNAARIRYERMQGESLVTGHGTAFGVNLSAWGLNGKRYLLSAAHNVLDDATKKPFDTLKIEFNEGTRTYWSQCKVILFDADLDLCLLESADDLPVILNLADRDIPLGDPVVMAGSPRGIPVKLYEGIMCQRYHQGTARSVVEIQFDHGCSGGPLYNATTGQIVGVAVAGIPKDGDLDHTKGLFVPINAVESFLERAASHPKRHDASRTVGSERPAPKKINLSTSPQLETMADSTPRVVVLSAKTLRSEIPEPKYTPVVDHSLPANVESVEIPAIYVIGEGDNLTRIAKRFNLTLSTLMSLNGMKDPNRILIGTQLRLK